MLKRFVRQSGIALATVVVASVLQACGPRSTTPPVPETATPEATQATVTKTPFERDLQFIRNGQFAHIWVFSRPDGKPLDKDDAAYLRQSAPQVVDWVTTDEGKRVIAGTNFDLERGNLPQLRKRFKVEDYTGK